MQLTAESLKKCLSYDPESGDFYWINRKRGAPKNKPAGCVSKAHGYRTICIDGVWHRAHRLAWLWMTGEWPTLEIDHKDRNRSNNAWSNLREATHQQNAINQGLRATNKSGVLGVSWDSSRNKWLAQIRRGGKKVNLGRFADKAAAILAWTQAAGSDNGDFRFPDVDS